jgi:hypothetical protein
MENEITRINQDNGRRLGGLLQSSNKTNQSLDETNRRLAMQNDMFSNFFRSFSKDSRKDEGNIAEEKKEAAVRERNRIASEKAALQRENSLTKYFKSGKGSVGGAGGDGAVPVSIQSLGPGLGAAGGLFGGIIKGVLKAVLAVGGFYLVLKNMPLIIEGFKKIKDFINPTDKDGKTRFDKIGEYLSGVMESAIKSLSSTVMKIFTPLIADISYRFGVLSAIFETIKNSLVEKLEILIDKFKLGLLEVGSTIENFFNEKVLPPFKSISESLEKLIRFIKPIFGASDKPLAEEKKEVRVNRKNRALNVVPIAAIGENIGDPFLETIENFNKNDSLAAKQARKKDKENDAKIREEISRLKGKRFLNMFNLPAMAADKAKELLPVINSLSEKIKQQEDKLNKESEYYKVKEEEATELMNKIRNKAISDFILQGGNTEERRKFAASVLNIKKGDVFSPLEAENAGLSQEEIAEIQKININAANAFTLRERTLAEEASNAFTPMIEESKKNINKKLEGLGEEGEKLKELVKALLKPSTAAPVNVTPINYSEDNSDTSQRYSFISSDSSPFDRYGKPIKEVFA